MKINESKTEVIKFSRRRPKRKHLIWKSKKIKIKDRATYPGITLDNNLKQEAHVKRRGRLAEGRSRRLFPLLRRESGLSLELRRKIYRTIFLPTRNYGEELWIVGSPQAGNRAEINARKLVRKICYIPWVIRNREIQEQPRLEDLMIRARSRRDNAITKIKLNYSPLIRQVGDRIP